MLRHLADADTLDFLGRLTAEHQQAAPAGAPGRAFYKSAYKGGTIDRLTRDWLPHHRSGDAAIGESWDLMLSRVRDLFRNEPVMKNMRRAIAKHVIGGGIATYADVMADAETPDDLFNDESDDLFERWSEDEADAEGRMDWPLLQWTHFNEVVESGESILLKCFDPDPRRTLPLCYQLIEPEQIDQYQNVPRGPDGSKTVRGIEYNKQGRAVAYWIFDAHPYDQYAGFNPNSQRIPAERVIHSFLPGRPSENRGVPWFSANIQSSRDLDWYIGNEMTAAALGALLTLIIKRKNGQGTGLGFAGGPECSEDSDPWGNSKVKLGRGIVADIGAEDSVEVAESKRPSRDSRPFIDLILQLQSMGAGVSKLRATGDYSQSSYTSARGAHLDDQAFFSVLGRWAGRSFVRPVRREHTIQAAAYGLYRTIGAKQFRNQQRNMLRMIVQPPGREQLDPEMETQAAKDRIDAGLSTWREECGLRGRHWRRVAIQQRRERDFFADQGLEYRLAPSAPAPRGDDRGAPAKGNGSGKAAAKPKPAPAGSGEGDDA